MAKRYELRIDNAVFLAMQKCATEAGIPSVAEYLRYLHSLHERRVDDATYLSLLSRASEPKVTQ